MNVQVLAKIFGIVLLVVGILGFVPGITTDEGLLLGIFQVNTLHNIVHIVTGLVALWAASSLSYSRTYFKVFGIVYLLVTILGFLSGYLLALGLVPVNMADNILHILIAVVALYAGFGTSGASESTHSQPMASTNNSNEPMGTPNNNNTI